MCYRSILFIIYIYFLNHNYKLLSELIQISDVWDFVAKWERYDDTRHSERDQFRFIRMRTLEMPVTASTRVTLSRRTRLPGKIDHDHVNLHVTSHVIKANTDRLLIMSTSFPPIRSPDFSRRYDSKWCVKRPIEWTRSNGVTTPWKYFYVEWISERNNKKAQHRSWHTAKCNML